VNYDNAKFHIHSGQLRNHDVIFVNIYSLNNCLQAEDSFISRRNSTTDSQLSNIL